MLGYNSVKQQCQTTVSNKKSSSTKVITDQTKGLDVVTAPDIQMERLSSLAKAAIAPSSTRCSTQEAIIVICSSNAASSSVTSAAIVLHLIVAVAVVPVSVANCAVHHRRSRRARHSGETLVKHTPRRHVAVVACIA